jgi:hypothetical protein
LFDFTIPYSLLSPHDDACLYESLLPLIPTVQGNRIYFVDAAGNSAHVLESFYYDLRTEIIIKNNVIQTDSFVPLVCSNKLVFGGAFAADRKPQVVETALLT